MDQKTIKVRVGDIDFTCLEMGDGPLVLALHGFPDEAPTWRYQMPAIAAAGYRVVAPYTRGYAPTSAAPDGCYQIAALGRDALGLIDALGADTATLLGHDWGALASVSAALEAPEKIDRLATVAIPYGPRMLMAYIDNYDQIRRSGYIFFFLQELADLAVPNNDFEFIERIWGEWSPNWTAPPEVMASVKRTLGEPGVLAAALGYYRCMFRAELQDPALAEASALFGAAPITVPALHIHGRNDGCMGSEICEGMDAMYTADFGMVMIEGAGHFVHQEKPEEFNKSLLDWLKR
ncbi:MAG: pimeloyl-ACP methyl ester carboxylesterase [Candidatus Binatia bacterium]|jgi:pimeloyl-ACP methyl ester carboxylesterase